MPVKRYFTNDSVVGGYTLPTITGWTTTGSSAGNALAIAPAGTGAASQGNDTSATNPNDMIVRRFVLSDQIVNAGNLEGAWSAVISKFESAAAADMFLRIVIRVTNSAGTADRGNAYVFQDAVELPTALTAATVSGTISTPIACQAGDRILIEVGVRCTNAVTTTYTANIRRGGTDSTDLQPGDTSTNAQNRPGYITFSGIDALFSTGPEGGRMLMSAA